MTKNESQSLKQPLVIGSLPLIRIDKVPIYLKELFDYCRSKKIEIDDKEVIKKLLYEYDVETHLYKGNDR